jgi:carbamoyltransferase
MSALLITTGHNASVIEVDNHTQKINWGYELERFTGVKSDSRFPNVITDRSRKPDAVYVTHWSPDAQLESVGHKYWQPEVCHGTPVLSLSHQFTHHDSHIYAAMWFAGPSYFTDGPVLGIVCDGFGNLGEHLSIYEISGPHTTKLLRRYRGYDTSLGLLYQYTTAFLGMKMHEDEYKLLGYETHINKVLKPAERQKLDADVTSVAAKWYENMQQVKLGDKYDPVFNLDALPAVKDKIFSMLSKVCTKYNVTDSSSHDGRAVIAYYVQSLLEEIMHLVVREYETSYRRVLMAGGVFYNVKLNWQFVNSEFERVCIFPLAGDQGNSLGLYYKCNPDFQFDGSLCIGHRPNIRASNVPGLVFCSPRNFPDVASQVISKFGFVNVVRGPMEFGPRALCNTSTLALPTMANVELINHVNGRNT